MLYVFDLDGTLRITKSGRSCPNQKEDQEILPNVLPVLRHLKLKGHTLAIATNQGGVSLGYFTSYMAWEIIKETQNLLDSLISSVEVSFYHPKGDLINFCRNDAKPKPDMLLRLINRYEEKAVMVGDGFVDQEAAQKAEIPFIFAHDFFYWPLNFVEKTEYGYSPCIWLKKWKKFKK
ncbi:MAG: HAD-IIIA family hydrolase [Patescibacteria group bacterium]|nr:HAD-IIIA family hydrolase [Patescibacteria group bacterium]